MATYLVFRRCCSRVSSFSKTRTTSKFDSAARERNACCCSLDWPQTIWQSASKQFLVEGGSHRRLLQLTETMLGVLLMPVLSRPQRKWTRNGDSPKERTWLQSTRLVKIGDARCERTSGGDAEC